MHCQNDPDLVEQLFQIWKISREQRETPFRATANPKIDTEDLVPLSFEHHLPSTLETVLSQHVDITTPLSSGILSVFAKYVERELARLRADSKAEAKAVKQLTEEHKLLTELAKDGPAVRVFALEGRSHAVFAVLALACRRSDAGRMPSCIPRLSSSLPGRALHSAAASSRASPVLHLLSS